MIKQELKPKQPNEDNINVPWGWIGAIIAVAYIAAVWIAYIVNEKLYEVVLSIDSSDYNVHAAPEGLNVFVYGAMLVFLVIVAIGLFIFIYNKTLKTK